MEESKAVSWRQRLCLPQRCEPWACVVGSRCPNPVGVNNERMGGQVVGTQLGLVSPLQVGTDNQGLGPGEGDCLHHSY